MGRVNHGVPRCWVGGMGRADPLGRPTQLGCVPLESNTIGTGTMAQGKQQPVDIETPPVPCSAQSWIRELIRCGPWGARADAARAVARPCVSWSGRAAARQRPVRLIRGRMANGGWYRRMAGVGGKCAAAARWRQIPTPHGPFRKHTLPWAQPSGWSARPAPPRLGSAAAA